MSNRETTVVISATLPSDDLPLAVQLARYLLVGGIAFLADFATLFVLTDWFHVHYLHSAVIAFLAGMGLNYLLSIAWVFKVRVVKNAKLEFLLFALIGIIGLGLNEIILWLLTQGLDLFYLHSKVVATVVILGWNFSARKVLLFSSSAIANPERSF